MLLQWTARGACTAVTAEGYCCRAGQHRVREGGLKGPPKIHMVTYAAEYWMVGGKLLLLLLMTVAAGAATGPTRRPNFLMMLADGNLAQRCARTHTHTHHTPFHHHLRSRSPAALLLSDGSLLALLSTRACVHASLRQTWDTTKWAS